MKSGVMMKNDNRNDRRTSGPAKGTGKTKATGKANAAGKTKVTAGKENRVPVGQGREKTAVKKKSGLCPVADKCGGCSWINKPYVEQLKNKLPFYKAGKRYKFKISEVDEWVRTGKIKE